MNGSLDMTECKRYKLVEVLAVHPQKPVGSLGTGAQDGHLDFHTAPEI